MVQHRLASSQILGNFRGRNLPRLPPKFAQFASIRGTVMRFLSQLTDLAVKGGGGRHVAVEFSKIRDKYTFSVYIDDEQNNTYQCYIHIL